ncbi:MAG: LacI family transcriptional regulator [Flammeovirgaceae bacterium]|nr:LacI family transcriptional regulator [Flammeovirgaceae bacterium]MBE62840.1 LacI family transcriptional regulator [Flammeovirgaceae bacterium]MBR06827.1 LacI family transcriptional regulator [Rickettsiales bacterium]
MMKNRSITIKHIAIKLGISTSTVSRALRDRPDVNPETKAKVKELARELNYEPNLIAVSLVSKKSYTIGVVVPCYHYFYAEAISGMEELALENDYHIMICNTRESYDLEKDIIHKLASKRVDGLIISLSRETKNFDHLDELKKKGIPYVLFNRVAEEVESSKVCVDDMNAAIQAVEHLINKGYKRIAHIQGPSDLLLSRKRTEGYVRALEKAGHPVKDQYMVHSDFSIKSGQQCTETLMSLPEPPDSIFCVCDEVAYGSMAWLKRHGYKIPQDVGVVGFTGEEFSEVIEPPLTTIIQPAYEVGKKSVEILLDRIGNSSLSNVTIELKTSLMNRESA